MSTPVPVLVAGPRGVEDRLAAMKSQGRLGVEARGIALEPGGGRDVADVRVLWRQGRATNDWVRAAIGELGALEWLHSDFVGIDGLPVAELAQRGVVVTNGAGNYSRPMAEWVILAMLAAAKQLAHFVRQSEAGAWDPTPELSELSGSVALFLGLGSVGTLAAPMAAALGVEVWGVARTERHEPPPGVARLIPAGGWRSALPAADFVVCALPLTPETERMIDAAALEAMKDNAWLINVARGELIDEEELIAALDRQTLGGAVLDAFETEPLPAGHPLWRRPNVIVVPHHTWSSAQVAQRMDCLFAAQLQAWVRGLPLANQVDLVAGY